jgi:uncharacterized repeat protein (TIGR01451 family)
MCLLFSVGAFSQVSTDISVTVQQLPSLTPCSGKGTFVVRLTNISTSPINNIVVRDSMPLNISYVPGSVSGTNVSFGSTIAANVVTFKVASLAASASVDIAFDATANCAVSTVPGNITNTYKVSWGTFFAAPLQTATYSILFPSLSITPNSTATYNANCLTPFVRSFTICNGGLGAVDSVTFTDAENQTSLIVQGFSLGTQSGLGTSSAKTVLKAADFMTVGNGDGKLDQNECIVLYDTLMVTGSASPITGTYKAVWGCNGNSCNNPSSNTYTLSTTINAGSPLKPALTRTLSVLSPPDTPGRMYNRTVKYRQVVKNTSSVTAVNVKVQPATWGLNFIVTDSLWASKNGGAWYHPSFAAGGVCSWGHTPANYSQAYAAFPNSGQPSDVTVSLGDLVPGDSVVITFETGTAGPITRVNGTVPGNECGNGNFCQMCGSCFWGRYGPSLSAAVDANTSWQGCPSGTFSLCSQEYPQKIYNGISPTALNEYDPTDANRGHTLGIFSNYNLFTDSTNLDGSRCAYGEGDTVRILMGAGSMDLPFYTDKSEFHIKIYTSGGIKWDGNLSRVFGRINSWTNNPWYASSVVDNTATDSTILVYFKRSNCPVPDFTTKDAYNCYRAGSWQLNIGFLNTCPGPAQKRLYMTRVYTIDTTSGEPAIEAGTNTFPSNFTWNSKCSGPCPDGASILNYSHARTTFGSPDNDQNGLPDATGSIDQSKVAINLITWGDTMQLKYKMVVHTTNSGGVPSLYVNSSINYSPAADAVTINSALSKAYPVITLIRPGVGTFTGTASSLPVTNGNTFLANLSLQGTGGVSIPGITTYLEGDTVLLTQNIIYNKAHAGWAVRTWGFVHVPYTAAVVNPTPAQQLRCDSAICNFRTVDMTQVLASSRVSGAACGDSVTFRFQSQGYISGSGCGVNNFPYEFRNVYTPVYLKIAIPTASNFSFGSVRLTWGRNIVGTGGNQCATIINNPYLPASLYSLVGDTLYLDMKQIIAYYGYDYRVNNLNANVLVDISVKYNLTVAGCSKDHLSPGYTFPIVYQFETSRPMDMTVNPTYYNGTSNSGNGNANLQWAGANGNNAVLYAGSSTIATQKTMIVPIRYTVSNGSGLNDNCWMAIPNTAGVTVDSVKEKATGKIIPMTPAGSFIYQLGNLGGNGSTKDYDIYTHLTQCVNTPFNIYADRTPCTGYPTSWASYACQSSAKMSTFTYTTYPGELQMTDSLFTTVKEICEEDTLQFLVANSQTQTANSVSVSFKLPANMSLVPGKTYLSYGNGSFVRVSDPVLSGSTYTWTPPASDTLAPVSSAPANLMYLRVNLATACGYVSGSQITSSIGGNVACGPITSLYNTNPQPLGIVGAPTLSYRANPEMTVSQLTSCGPGSDADCKIVLHISGGETTDNSKVTVNLPQGYVFRSYDASSPGSHNAPAGQPVQGVGTNGAPQLTWSYYAGTMPGDSIVFVFKYNQDASLTNACATVADRVGYINTYIQWAANCTRTGISCDGAILNGSDTSAVFRSMKPLLTASVDNTTFGKGTMHISGSISNSGTADVPSGTPLTMEIAVDMDGSGTINAGDSIYKSYVYTNGLVAGQSVKFDYYDSTSHAACQSCLSKNILLRFANTLADGGSQCLCSDVVTRITNYTALPISLDYMILAQNNCTSASVKWKTLTEAPGNVTFWIETSTDGVHFKPEKMIVGKGDINGAAYQDEIGLNTAVLYVRLKQVENGKVEYSPVRYLKNNCDQQQPGLLVYPNPLMEGQTLSLKVEEVQGGTINVRLVDVTGRILNHMALEVKAGQTEFTMPAAQKLIPGIYVVQVVHTDGSRDVKQFIRH